MKGDNAQMINFRNMVGLEINVIRTGLTG
uniref:Uncharacterized protein n=1 Tax=Rhizophora mucronata TaxID=61149 RepID=A0A2P2NS32_RHIMU